MNESTHDVVILGSGPAGCTAALYASRANLDVLVIAGYEWGGQLMLTTDVENYPGFPDGIMGPDLMEMFRKQAERFGATFVEEDATELRLQEQPLQVQTDSTSYKARTVIIATGSEAKWLGLESEQRLRGKGVSACATCDGFFFKDKDVVVVGGGDSAMEESLFLTKYASKVYVVHRRDELRASKIMQDRAFAHDKIEFIWNSAVEEVLGEDAVEGVRIKNVENDETSTLECQGFFLAIGHEPNSQLVKETLTVDDVGYIVPTGKHDTYTDLEGVFVAGDIHDPRYRQAVTAAGAGCKAAIDAERWLETQEAKPEAVATPQ